MPESTQQKRVTGRVMHEFAHGELNSGPDGKAGKVKNRRQAIAIALSEAGASKYDSKRAVARNLRRTEGKQAKGETGQQEREGRAKIGAKAKRESTRAMGGVDAQRRTAGGRKTAATRARRSDGFTRQELYAKAQRKGVEGRSKMTKQQLKTALGLS